MTKPAEPAEPPPPLGSEPPDAELAPPLEVDEPATPGAPVKPAPTPEDVQTRDEPGILRTRYVEVDWKALDGSGGPPGNQLGGGGRLLRLELFEDVSLTAVLDRAEARPPDVLIWVGQIEGMTDSQVGLVVEGERLRGDISLPSAYYQGAPSATACTPSTKSTYRPR